MDLDDIFLKGKADVAVSVLKGLRDPMFEYGYEILETLVVDVSPDYEVRVSMNEINEAKRLKEAMIYKGDAGE